MHNLWPLADNCSLVAGYRSIVFAQLTAAGAVLRAKPKSSGLLPSLVSYRTLAHLYTSRREVVSGAWTSVTRNSQSGAIYTLRAGLSSGWGAWQWAAHAPVSQAALNYRSCGIDDAILH